MKFNTLKTLTIAFCLIITAVAAQAQDKKKGETIVTAPKLVIAKLKVSEGEAVDVRGKVTFTLTSANSDSSLAGTISYALPEDVRQKIAQISGKPLAQVPATVTQADVVGEFQKLTECPVVHIEFKPMDLMVAGAKVHFNRFAVDISENGKEINLMVCTIARQITKAMPYRGPVRRINQIINGEESQQ